MSLPRTPQRERRAQTRGALLRAAGRVFAERGYHAATLEDVFTAAGVSRGALYHYFDSKQDLFAALLEDRLTAAAAEAEDAGTPHDGDNDQAATFLRRVADDKRWLPLLLEFLALGARDPHTRTRVISYFIQPARARVAAVITKIYPNGLDRAPLTIDELAIATTALINGLAIEQAFDPDGVPDSLAGRVFGLITDSLAQHHRS